MSNLKNYHARGVLRLAKANFDINTHISAYSEKQARLKLAFEIRKRFPEYEIAALYRAIRVSKIQF